MMTLNDGRSELWQWDTGRTLAVDADCSQVHFSNKVFGRSIDVDVADGTAIIPDILLQTDKDLNVWAFVGTAENGYTKISKTFKVNRRNKPADYVFTPPDQTSLEEIKEKLDYLESIQDPDAIKNAVEGYLEQNPVESPVQSVNGQTGEVELTAKDVGAISQDDLQEATNEALAQAKASGEFDGADGQPGENGADGYSPTANVTQNDNGAAITITDKNGTTTATVTNGKDGADGIPGKDGADGKDGAPGSSGKDGITPTIGDNGNWYLGDTDTGKPSRGETGPAGADGRDGADGAQGPAGVAGKSAYQYAQEGGYTGTEAEFAAKLAQKMPTTLPNPNAITFTGAVTGTYDGSAPVSVEIPDGGSGDSGEEKTWRLIGSVTTEEAVNSAYITLPDDITEVLLHATQTGGAVTTAQFAAFAWSSGSAADIFAVGNTATTTTNQRCVSRLRKIQIDGTTMVDMVSSNLSAGANAVGSNTSVYVGNALLPSSGQKAGFRMLATANALPIGFSFKVYGR